MNRNKGFSLVELIVVIAIMAVLVGIIAPQFLGYVEAARTEVCKTSRNEIERMVSTKLAGDTDGSFKSFLTDNYGVNSIDDMNKAGNDIAPLLNELNLPEDYEICKSEGTITANFYESVDRKSFLFKLLCSEHDLIIDIPIIDFGSGNEKSSMSLMSSLILDMYDYYVVNNHDDLDYSTQFGNALTDSEGNEYYKFEKFSKNWKKDGPNIYPGDIDDYIKEVSNENQDSDILINNQGNNSTQFYFTSNEKDLTENSVHSAFSYVDHNAYVYFADTDKLYIVPDARTNYDLRVDERAIKDLVASGSAEEVQ